MCKYDKEDRMPRVYVCSQFEYGNMDTNLEFDKVFCSDLIQWGYLPVCAPLYFRDILKDGIASQAERRTRFGIELLADCEKLVVYSRIREDEMVREILAADSMGIEVQVADLSVIYSEDQAPALEEEIIRDLENVRLIYGEKYHTAED
ncbi:MAG: hypothetical protein LUD50_03040 [Clostridia bacterium]|nr:hypothetical protein [Clostridia bacterium]